MGRGSESVAASFLTLAPKTAVVDRFGNVVGRVERVLVTADSYFDGIIVATDVGRRFVDAPEVRSIRESEVVLATVKHDVEHPGEPRVLGAHAARWGRQHVIPDDREAVIAALKHAFVHDRLDVDQLAHAVEQAHTLDSLDALEALVPPRR
jgi:hypothetical protein